MGRNFNKADSSLRGIRGEKMLIIIADLGYWPHHQVLYCLPPYFYIHHVQGWSPTSIALDQQRSGFHQPLTSPSHRSMHKVAEHVLTWEASTIAKMGLRSPSEGEFVAGNLIGSSVRSPHEIRRQLHLPTYKAFVTLAGKHMFRDEVLTKDQFFAKRIYVILSPVAKECFSKSTHHHNS